MLKAHNLRYPQKKGSFLLGMATACLTMMPVQAAEKLFFIYSPLNFSVEVSGRLD